MNHVVLYCYVARFKAVGNEWWCRCLEQQRRKEEQGERSRRKKAKEVFDMFDADGSHTISTSEMKVK